VNSELERMWEEEAECVTDVTTITKNWSPGLDLNQGYFEYDAALLSTRPRGSVINKQWNMLHSVIIFRIPSVWTCKSGQKTRITDMAAECLYCSTIPMFASKPKEIKCVIKL
jgi:hypothetical protein